jgi:hypothetical protein
MTAARRSDSPDSPDSPDPACPACKSGTLRPTKMAFSDGDRLHVCPDCGHPEFLKPAQPVRHARLEEDSHG